jgi:hypothetical protein
MRTKSVHGNDTPSIRGAFFLDPASRTRPFQCKKRLDMYEPLIHLYLLRNRLHVPEPILVLHTKATTDSLANTGAVAVSFLFPINFEPGGPLVILLAALS